MTADGAGKPGAISSASRFIFLRTVSTPRDLLFRLHTESDHLKRWMLNAALKK